MTHAVAAAGRPTLRDRVADPRALPVLALAIGLGAGAGAVGFRYLIQGLTHLFTGHADYAAAGHAANPLVPGLGRWFVVLAPVVGGLLYGPLVTRLAPEAKGHGVPEVMLAVAEGGGRIRPRVPVVKAFASALCIGSGGSVGREGPIVQIGAALGSTLGQAVRAPTVRLRLLVACGAAAGISATFNAPIAGVFFALEVILRDFEAQAFGAVVLSSVVAAALARGLFGSASFLHLPPFELTSPLELVPYALLGVLAGVVAVGFVRFLYAAEDAADRAWRGPEWLRPAVGGVLLGLLLLVLPEMYGVGYPVLSGAIEGHYAIAFLAVLLVGKVAATSLTLAIGGSGGVFAPSLFMGAMLGSGLGQAVHGALPHATAGAGAYGLVGMGAVFAGAARAPITAVLIVFELTGEYSVILPLMVAVVLATSISARLSRDTVYTLKLRRRGIHIDRPRVVSVMRTVPVAQALGPAPRNGSTAVIHEHDGELPLYADDVLESAVHRLAETEDAALPVHDRASGDVLGWVTHRSVLAAYRQARERVDR